MLKQLDLFITHHMEEKNMFLSLLLWQGFNSYFSRLIDIVLFDIALFRFIEFAGNIDVFCMVRCDLNVVDINS